MFGFGSVLRRSAVLAVDAIFFLSLFFVVLEQASFLLLSFVFYSVFPLLFFFEAVI